MAGPFKNPFWTALTTEQSHFAVGTPPALRYPADVIPFVALESVTPESLSALHNLLSPGESIHLLKIPFQTSRFMDSATAALPGSSDAS